MKNHIALSFYTWKDITSVVFGRSLLDVLRKEQRLSPEFVAQSEPINIPFPGADAFVKDWWAKEATTRVDGRVESVSYWGPFFSRRKTVRYWAFVKHRFVSKNGKVNPASLTIHSDVAKNIDWLSLFSDICSVLMPFQATMHLFSAPELEPVPFNSTESAFRYGNLGVKWGDFNKYKVCIPNLGWANFFGDDFAKEVDIAKLRSHRCQFREIGNGYLFWLSHDIMDVINDFPTFSSRRAETKQLFRSDLFEISKIHLK